MINSIKQRFSMSSSSCYQIGSSFKICKMLYFSESSLILILNWNIMYAIMNKQFHKTVRNHPVYNLKLRKHVLVRGSFFLVASFFIVRS